MKYTSEIIHEIIETEGHIAPSTFHYESECKKEWIEYNRGGYPKLTDYEGEWLNYHLENAGIGKFPYLAFTNITQATVDNCVPIPFKSAILKGNTLVNCIVDSSRNGYSYLDGNIIVEDEGWLTIEALTNNNHFELAMDNLIIKPSTKYLLVIECESNSFQGNNNMNIGNTYQNAVDSPWVENLQIKMLPVGISTYILTTKSDFSILNNPIGCRSYIGVGKGATKFRYMIIEYQDGMESWDIPYFEGMQSVQMPVLTTSNEDGTKTNILTVNEDVTLRGIGNVKDEVNLLTGELTQRIGEYIYMGESSVTYRESMGTYLTIVNVGANIGFAVGNGTGVVSDKLLNQLFNESDVGVYGNQDGKLYIFDKTVNSAEEFITKHKGTIFNFVLIEPSVKTVDLSVINQDGETTQLKAFEGTTHIQTNGQPIKPLLDIEVPVEAITQNLASFIEEE